MQVLALLPIQRIRAPLTAPVIGLFMASRSSSHTKPHLLDYQRENIFGVNIEVAVVWLPHRVWLLRPSARHSPAETLKLCQRKTRTALRNNTDRNEK